jgi:neutral ceramidase
VPFLGALQGLAASEEDYPGAAPFAVIRIGDLLLGTVPAEVSVTAGARMRDAMMAGAREAGWEPRAAALMTLTGGYLYYTTTREEYGLQFYEGSSTLRGPGQAEVFGGILGTLAARLSPEAGSPPSDPTAPGAGDISLEVHVPGIRDLLPPSRLVEPPPPTPLLSCDADGALTARWLDIDPARRLPRPGPWVTLIREDTGEVVATDADPRIEMVMGELDALGRWWLLRDTATRPGVPYRVEVAGIRDPGPVITCPRP